MAPYRSSLRRPEHPLARPSDGRVFRARLVLYEKLNGQDAPCHWCGKDLIWTVDKGGADSLRADHLDQNILNDHPDNLVPSCHSCNGMREREGAGSFIDILICPTCKEEFKPVARRRRFCSRACANRSWR